MANLTQLRMAARAIFDEALRDVDAGAAVKNAVGIEPSRVNICDTNFELTPDRRVFSVAIGKAAVPMAVALEQTLADRFMAGVISGPDASARKPSNRWQYFAGGHPLPSDASLAAAKAALALLERANDERSLVIFLVSGGGSAMLESPITADITLADLRVANRVLVEGGASISEINAVRRAFSGIKGGRLAARALNCAQATLIVSDVPIGQEWNVASGPTLLPPKDAPSPDEVVGRYGLGNQLPPSILRAIENSAAGLPEQKTDHPHFVLLDNDTALEAAADAAAKRGFTAEIARDISDEEIEVGCEKLFARLSSSARSHPEGSCLISGGEFACPVRGNGIGGRSLETALRLAISADQNSERVGEFVALCAGTDGIDGNSPAAGAIVDHTTMERARKIGLEPRNFLNRSDSYSFFVALGDVITTGPTGTNVRDVRILLSVTR